MPSNHQTEFISINNLINNSLKYKAMKKIILSFLVFISLQASSQTVYVVTKNTDPIPFVDYYNFIDSLCDPDMYGTFQWALRKANDTPGACEIRFNIPGSGPHIILLSGYLPGTTKTIYINGASQPGYQPGNPQIIFDGQETVFCFLNFYSTKNVTIEGIYIRNLTTCGIWCYIPDSLTIKNCVINQITNNTSTFGIYFHTPSYCTLQGNYIGTDNQNASLPIKSYGIAMWFYANHNLIGGTENGQANIISNCGTSGIYIGIESSYNHISGNIITNNPKAILLGQGANQSKQAPVITSATADTVSGTSAPGDIIEIFGSTGNENANEYLGTTITDANSDWTINNVQTSFNYVVATATDIEGNTSIVSLVKSTTIQACKDEVLHYHISGVNTNSPVHITITYPNDINGLDSASIQEYPATSIQIDTTNPSIPQYTFNAPDTSFTFNYHIIAGCKNFSPTTQNIHYSINQDGIISTDSFN